MSQYTCAICQIVFESVETENWNTKKALEEFESEFPDEQKEAKVLVCDTCYKIAMGYKTQDNQSN